MDQRFVVLVLLMFQCANCTYRSSCERCQFQDTVLTDLRIIKENMKGTTPSCAPGWEKFEGSCYFFNTSPSNFIEAARVCQAGNAHLVHVNDASESNFVKRRARQTRDNSYWWIGLTDTFHEGVWMWIDNWSQANYTDWMANEPNSDVERCANLHSQGNFQWNDGDCLYECYSICEQRL